MIKTKDGVEYSNLEIRQMQRLKAMYKDQERFKEVKEKVHMLKKKLGCEMTGIWKTSI